MLNNTKEVLFVVTCNDTDKQFKFTKSIDLSILDDLISLKYTIQDLLDNDLLSSDVSFWDCEVYSLGFYRNNIGWCSSEI